MSESFIYRSAAFYELVMLVLYGRHYASRYHALSGLIPPGAGVLDLCCGPAILYDRYLRDRDVAYTGVDINERFITRLRRRGGRGIVQDIRKAEPLPGADYVVMQASLYHFLPDPAPIVDRMIEAASKKVIIAEPIRNLTTSSSGLLSLLSSLSTNPGTGSQSLRFNGESLDEFFAGYRSRVEQSFLIAGAREKVFVLRGGSTVTVNREPSAAQHES
jgi:SAM-dependent methyltransferase